MYRSCFAVFFIGIQVVSIRGYVSKCVIPGIKCSDCEHLTHCVTTPRGMISHTLNFCNNSLNEFCSVTEGGCSSDPTSCKIFGMKTFPCQNSSTFPDPYDCNSYHHCIMQVDGSLTPIRYTCPEDRAYDPLSGTCRFKANHRVCKEFPVPKCQYPLETGALKENSAIYYVCVKLTTENTSDIIPLLYRCRTGEEYKSTANACVEAQDSITFTCVKEGRFIDVNDSSKYYKCNKNKTYVHKKCGEGQYFSISKARCEKIPDLSYD